MIIHHLHQIKQYFKLRFLELNASECFLTKSQNLPFYSWVPVILIEKQINPLLGEMMSMQILSGTSLKSERLNQM